MPSEISIKPAIVHVTQALIPANTPTPVPALLKQQVITSQFNVAKTLLANPHAIIILQGLTSTISVDITKKNFIDDRNKILAALFEDFHFDDFNETFTHGFPESLQRLTSNQQAWLIKLGGALTLFALGNIHTIYALQNKQEESKAEIHALPLLQSRSTKKLVDHHQQEEIHLLQSAARAHTHSGSKHPLVLAVFTDHYRIRDCVANHRDHVDFEGKVITLHTQNLLENKGKKYLPASVLIVPSSISISVDQFEEILKRYDTIYKSTSSNRLSFNKYHSKSMKTLDALATYAKSKNYNNITYADTFNSLLKTAEFDKAEHFVKEKIEPTRDATSCVIRDLRAAFVDAYNNEYVQENKKGLAFTQ